jgi:hypothetical protein
LDQLSPRAAPQDGPARLEGSGRRLAILLQSRWRAKQARKKVGRSRAAAGGLPSPDKDPLPLQVLARRRAFKLQQVTAALQVSRHCIGNARPWFLLSGEGFRYDAQAPRAKEPVPTPAGPQSEVWPAEEATPSHLQPAMAQFEAEQEDENLDVRLRLPSSAPCHFPLRRRLKSTNQAPDERPVSVRAFQRHFVQGYIQVCVVPSVSKAEEAASAASHMDIPHMVRARWRSRDVLVP